MNRTENTPERLVVYGGTVVSGINDLLADHPELISGFPQALVSRIDGDHELPSKSGAIREALAKDSVRPQWVGDSLLVSGSDLVEMNATPTHDYMRGFAEVWLFGDHRTVEPPPEGLSIISGARGHGRAHLEDGVPQELADWVLTSGCVLGLGDHADLNYITIDPTLASYLDSLGKPGG